MARKIPPSAVPAFGEVAWALGHLPERLRARAAGDPIVIDGQVLDPGVQASLPMATRLGRRGPEGASPAEARRTLALGARLARGHVIRVESARDLRIGGAAGEIGARLYTPRRLAGDGLLVYYHGGGWVEGDLDTHDQPCRFLAAGSGHRVLSVDYRLAPEHPFPAAADDAVAAFLWASEHAAELGAAPGRIAVGGDSAGGNLSAVVCQQTAAAGGPVPRMQVLIYPACDASRPYPSHELFREGFFLETADMDWFLAHYRRTEEDLRDPRLSPMLATSLEGQPPAYVTVAGFDPIRDEGIEYARRLAAAGVPTELRVHRGLIHGFANTAGINAAARRAIGEIAEAVRAGLA